MSEYPVEVTESLVYPSRYVLLLQTEEKQDEVTSEAIPVSPLSNGATKVDVAMFIAPTTYGSTIGKDYGDRDPFRTFANFIEL